MAENTNRFSFFEGRRVTVTGGASFIGSHLCDCLSSYGAEITVLDDLSSGKSANLDSSAAKLEVIDLADSPESTASAISEAKPEVLFHLAAIHGGRGFIETYPELILRNLAIDNFTFSAAKKAGCEIVVHGSSACAYPVTLQDDPDDRGLLSEESAGFNSPGEAYPDGVYGWVKLMGEYQLANMCEGDGGLVGRSARIFTAYGERENESHAAIALIAKALLQMDPYPVWGDGLQTRNFTHVRDTVHGLMLLGQYGAGPAFDVFNVGSSQHVRVLDFIEEIFNQLEWRPASFDFQLDKPVGVASRASDNSKILAEFGWEPSLGLSEGIGRTLEWYSSKSDRPMTMAELDEVLLARG